MRTETFLLQDDNRSFKFCSHKEHLNDNDALAGEWLIYVAMMLYARIEDVAFDEQRKEFPFVGAAVFPKSGSSGEFFTCELIHSESTPPRIEILDHEKSLIAKFSTIESLDRNGGREDIRCEVRDSKVSFIVKPCHESLAGLLHELFKRVLDYARILSRRVDSIQQPKVKLAYLVVAVSWRILKLPEVGTELGIATDVSSSSKTSRKVQCLICDDTSIVAEFVVTVVRTQTLDGTPQPIERKDALQ